MGGKQSTSYDLLSEDQQVTLVKETYLHVIKELNRIHREPMPKYIKKRVNIKRAWDPSVITLPIDNIGYDKDIKEGFEYFEGVTTSLAAELVTTLQYLWNNYPESAIFTMLACTNIIPRNDLKSCIGSSILEIATTGTILNGDEEYLQLLDKCKGKPIFTLVSYQDHATLLVTLRHGNNIELMSYNPHGETGSSHASTVLVWVSILISADKEDITLNSRVIGCPAQLQTDRHFVSGYCIMWSFLIMTMYIHFHEYASKKHITISDRALKDLERYFIDQLTPQLREMYILHLTKHIAGCVYNIIKNVDPNFHTNLLIHKVSEEDPNYIRFFKKKRRTHNIAFSKGSSRNTFYKENPETKQLIATKRRKRIEYKNNEPVTLEDTPEN